MNVCAIPRPASVVVDEGKVITEEPDPRVVPVVILVVVIPALKVCNDVNVCVMPRPAIVVDVVGNVSVAVPDPTRVISAPDTPRVLDVEPPAMLNPSALFVISRLTEFCFAIFIPIYYEPPPL